MSAQPLDDFQMEAPPTRTPIMQVVWDVKITVSLPQEVFEQVQRGVEHFKLQRPHDFIMQAIQNEIEANGLDREVVADREFAEDSASYHCQEVRGMVR